MIIVNRTEKDIAGAINGKPFSIPFNAGVYNLLKDLVEELKQTTVGIDPLTVDKALIKTIYDEAIALTTLNINEVIAHSNPYLAYNPTKQEYYIVANKDTNEEAIDDRPIPSRLVDKIIESFEKGFDFMPYVKAWARFLNRDKQYSITDAEYFAKFLDTKYYDHEIIYKLITESGLTQSAAEDRATFNDISLTEEGLMALYKVVEEVKTEWILETDDFGNVVVDGSGQPRKKKVISDKYKSQYNIDPVTGETTVTENKPVFAEDRLFTPAIHKNGEKFYSGNVFGYVYKVGEVQYLPKINPTTKQEAIVNYNNTSCGGGLYAGGLTYIQSYKSKDTVILVCFADPSNIISFQDEGHAIRLWELFPHNILEDEVELKGFYHSSKYAAESAERTKNRIAEIVAKRLEEINKAKESLEAKASISEKLNNM